MRGYLNVFTTLLNQTFNLSIDSCYIACLFPYFEIAVLFVLQTTFFFIATTITVLNSIIDIALFYGSN